MSMKVYNGYRLPVAQFSERVAGLQDVVSAALVAPVAQMVARRVAESRIAFERVSAGVDLDRPALGPLPRGASPGTLAWRVAMLGLSDKAEELSGNRTRPRDPFEDTNFHVNLWFCGDDFLVTGVGELDAVRKAAMAHLGARDFSYWDNSDRPEDVGEVEWADRRESWREVLDADFSHVSWVFNASFWFAERCMTPGEELLDLVATELHSEHGHRLGLSSVEQARRLMDSPVTFPVPEERANMVRHIAVQRRLASEAVGNPSLGEGAVDLDRIDLLGRLHREIDRGRPWRHLLPSS